MDNHMVAELRALAKLQVRADLLREARASRDIGVARRAAVANIVEFVSAQPGEWRDAHGVLLESERRARLELAQRYMVPEVVRFFSEKGITVGEFVSMYAGVDRRAFVLAVLDAKE